MSYNINTLSDVFHRLSEHIENTKQFITKADIWLISPQLAEVPLVDQPTVIGGIEKIIKYGKAYANDVSVMFEIIKFVVKWPT